jgi:hypothetical protein
MIIVDIFTENPANNYSSDSEMANVLAVLMDREKDSSAPRGESHSCFHPKILMRKLNRNLFSRIFSLFMTSYPGFSGSNLYV